MSVTLADQGRDAAPTLLGSGFSHGRSSRGATIRPGCSIDPASFVLLIVPLVVGIGYSFRRFTAFRSEYVGLDQYRRCWAIRL